MQHRTAMTISTIEVDSRVDLVKTCVMSSIDFLSFGLHHLGCLQLKVTIFGQVGGSD